MRMVLHRARLGEEHGDDAERAADPLAIGGERLDGFADEQGVLISPKSKKTEPTPDPGRPCFQRLIPYFVIGLLRARPRVAAACAARSGPGRHGGFARDEPAYPAMLPPSSRGRRAPVSRVPKQPRRARGSRPENP